MINNKWAGLYMKSEKSYGYDVIKKRALAVLMRERGILETGEGGKSYFKDKGTL